MDKFQPDGTNIKRILAVASGEADVSTLTDSDRGGVVSENAELLQTGADTSFSDTAASAVPDSFEFEFGVGSQAERAREEELTGLVFEVEEPELFSQQSRQSGACPQSAGQPESHAVSTASESHAVSTASESHAVSTASESHPVSTASESVQAQPERSVNADDGSSVGGLDFTTGTASGIRVSYVPTFTGAADSYYAESLKRALYGTESAEERSSLEAAAEQHAPTQSTVSLPTEDDIDPTAELDGNASGADTVVIDTTRSNAEDDGRVVNIFKFASTQPQPPHRAIRTAASTESTVSARVASSAEPAPRGEREAAEAHVNSAASNNTSSDSQIRYPSPRVLPRADSHDGPDTSDGERTSAEYTSYAQRDSFKDKFLDGILAVRVRFFVALVLSLGLLFIEVVWAFKLDFVHLEFLPTLTAKLDMLIVACLLALAMPEIVRAIRQLVTGKVCPELNLLVSFAVLLIYTAVISIYSPVDYSLFGLLYAISVLAAIGGSCYDRLAGFEAFKVVATGGEKIVADIRMTRTLDKENMALDGAVDEYKSRTVRRFKASFVTGFMKRVRCSVENRRNVIMSMAISAGVAVVVGTVAFFIYDGAISAVSAFALVFMLSSPTFSLLLHKLPYYHATREAASESCAVIGEASLAEYACTDVITFEDSEVFGEEDVVIKRVIYFGEQSNLTRAYSRMYSIFSVVGGPLKVIFSKSLEHNRPDGASNIIIEDDGIYAELDGHKILAGSREYMLRLGLVLPSDDTESRASAMDSTRIMYAAEDGRIYAKFYIRYTFSEEFTMLLPILKDEGIIPLIYTRDPNISASLCKLITNGSDTIRVLRRYDTEQTSSVIYRRAAVGMISTAERDGVVNLVLLAKRYARLQNGFAVAELSALIAGVALSAVLSFGNMLFLPSIILAVWQLGWCLALGIVTSRTFTKTKQRKNERYENNDN